MTLLLAAGCGVLGLLVGSFLNVVIHRVPKKESVVKPRSRCPGCGTELAARDNIPVVSWLLLHGRCRTCGMGISARYPLVELACAALFVAAAVRFGADWVLPAFLVLFAALLAISAVDLDLRIVPNRIVYPALFLSVPLLVLAAAMNDDWRSLRDAAIGGALGWFILAAIHFAYPAGMGFGDVRLTGLMSVHLGWLSIGHVLVGIFMGFLTGAVIGVGLMAVQKAGRKAMIPFGPFLAMGAVIAVLFGRPILDWYAP